MIVRPALLLLASIGWASAAAAENESFEALRQGIAGACTASPGGQSGTIKAGALGRAIFASGYAPLTFQFEWVQTGSAGIAAAAFSKPAAGENTASLYKLNRLITSWMRPETDKAGAYLPLQAGGVEIRRSNGTPWPGGKARDVLEAVLDGKDAGLLILCAPPSNSAPDPAPAQVAAATAPDEARVDFVITRAPADMTIGLPADRPPAEVAFTQDFEARERTLSVFGTAGLRWHEFQIGKTHLWPMAFVQLEREGSTSDPDAIDNLAIGFQIDGFFQQRQKSGGEASHYFAVNGRYMSDTRFDSRSWSLAARFTPQINLPGNDVEYELPMGLAFHWLLSGTFDLLAIDSPGRKAELADASSWTRIGLDAAAYLTLRAGGGAKVQLRGSYALRHNLASGPGDAQLLSAQLLYLPNDMISFGLSYDLGRNLDSLTRNNVLRATFGLRK
ncbi:hypothetical protein [Sandarakinorhabdus sp.]|uniref:hypothetical protein n=1 Tax=Sandarakinorhabdus sp. TaxID=1916663 RepID=UPI00286E5BC9|nr:hypothetical protein [Sandarakinorhabdus sp.]